MFQPLHVSAHGGFKGLIKDLKASHPLEAGQALTIRIVSVAFTGGLPEIIGVCAPEDSNQVIVVKCLEF